MAITSAHTVRSRAVSDAAPVSVLPSLPLAIGGALAWGLAMAGSALLSLWLHGRWQNFHLETLLFVYFAGGFAAWPIALPLARVLTRHHRLETRFAGHFAVLSLGTVAMTAFVFGVDYRAFYAQWHQPFGTPVWAFQFAFTVAGAAYQFLVMGLGLYLPVGLPLLAGASLWLSRSMR
jgi:hypothetical protein